MVKYICDKCGREVCDEMELKNVRVTAIVSCGDEALGNSQKKFYLCGDCYKELTEGISSVQIDYCGKFFETSKK